ncbi:MAG: C40 family peptidase [Bacteroidetes bacterium]|nr:C40 family peptidase [Bacteroidota bacterium]HET6243441.1 C40 family peptidase [Bacteroidia bacterium]
MKFGICNLGIVPCRAEPSDKSEMVTQLLFGEHFQVISEHKSWSEISIAFDNYKAWIDNKQFLPISEDTYNELNEIPPALTFDLVQVVLNTQSGAITPVVIGSSLPLFNGESCNLQGYEYAYEGQHIRPSQLTGRLKLIEIAYTYLNSPYLWGGRTPFGIDCSGFTQICYKLSGFSIPRDAFQQAEMGETLSFVEESQQGDLAFFDNADGKIVHVGIVLNNNQIIHASGRVRIDKFDHYGIYNTESGSYSHNLRLLKRLIE